MSKMDDVLYYECDLYVEDERAERVLLKLIVARFEQPRIGSALSHN